VKNLKRLLSLLSLLVLLGSAHLASASVITEEYTGSQDVWEGDSFSFDFDLWYENNWPVNDNAPGMKLTTDGTGAFGTWSAADLYIGFLSTDADPEVAQIDLNAWTFRLWGIPLGSQDVLFQTLTFSKPSAGNNNYLANYSLSNSQVGLLDNFGGGTLKLTASRQPGFDNDFTITRVGLRATSVPEPATLSLGIVALIALAFIARRRRTGFIPAAI
jgi:hypothetical protein